MPETTWGQLTDADAGKPVALRFWWDPDTTVTATFRSTMGSFGTDADGVELIRNVLDYGPDSPLGVSETQLRSDTPVTVDGTTAPAQEPPPTAVPGDSAPDAPAETPASP